jgi:hypothetical protein
MPNVRYDKIFAEMGCHPEFVQKDSELKPALKRAFDYVRDKSMPAFVEVFVDDSVMHDVIARFIAVLGGAIEWEELPLESRKLLIEQNMLTEPGLSLGAHPSWKEAVERHKKGEKIY